MRKAILIGAAVGLVMGAGFWHGSAQGDQPAPTATVSASADYSTPSKALQSMLEAVKAKDSPAIRRSLYIDATHKEGAEIVLAAIDASIHLQKSMGAKFGKAGADALGGANGADAMLTARFKAVEDAPVKITGDDTAVMQVDNDTTKSPSGGKVYFKKSDGQWRVDITSMLNMDDPQVRQMLPVMAKLGEAMESTAKEVDAGKLVTVQDTVQTLNLRVMAIVQAARAAATAATQPSK